MRHELLLLHASRAAVEPVAGYYLREARDLRPVNLLDEGVMGGLREREWTRSVARLATLANEAVREYGVRGVMVTCSALGPEEMEALRRACGVPAIKIDEPMLEEAKGKVGLVATFAATVETSLRWLAHYHPQGTVEVELDEQALQALLGGDEETHDRRLMDAAKRAAAKGVERIVLAQVSMARLAEPIAAATGLPVHESLTSSLRGVRRLLAGEPEPPVIS